MPSSKQRFLCVAYAFPPINRSGTFRTLGFIKHLARLGWSANVITSEPKDESIDEELLSEIPDGTIIHRVRWEDRVVTLKRYLGFQPPQTKVKQGCGDVSARSIHDNKNNLRRSCMGMVKDWGTRLLHLPDSRSGWIKPAIQCAKQINDRHPIDLIYSTSPYASAHLIALKIKRQTKLPWIADFRDPWCGNPYTKKKFFPHQYIELRMERAVLECADRIVVNTPAAKEKLQSRYPRFQHKCVTILNGFDSDIMDRITPIRSTSPDIFSLVHCGQFYGPRSPLVLFKAIHALMNIRPQLAKQFKLTLVGSTSYNGNPLVAIAKKLCIDSVIDVVGATSHADSLRYMAGSDALALIGSAGSNADLQIPNKLFEYLSVQKPILAISSDNHPSIDILRRAKARFISYQIDDTQGITTALDALLKQSFVYDERIASAVGQYDRKHRAQELADLFNQLMVDNDPSGGRVLSQASITAVNKNSANQKLVYSDTSQPSSV